MADSAAESGPIAPITPAQNVQAEILNFIEHNDSTRLWPVYSGLQRGLSAEEIAAELGVATSRFVWNYTQTLNTLTLGKIPTSTTMANAGAAACRRLLRQGTWSNEARNYLQQKMEELQSAAENEGVREVEDEQAKRKTDLAEAKNTPGIYVYALPHYLRHPFDASGRTLMKVGHSESDTIQRFRNQVRTTALPEEPILLRIYHVPPGRPSKEIEAQFHRLMETAGHSRNVARTAGREWFVTSVPFLDEVASMLNLELEAVASPDLDVD